MREKTVVAFVGSGHRWGMLYFIAASIGLCGGVASVLFGVGGGIVMVPAMMFFLKMPFPQATGTSLLVIVPTAIMGTCKHKQIGNINWTTALMLMPTAIAGGYLGSWLPNTIPVDNLKKTFGGLLIFAGCKLLFFK